MMQRPETLVQYSGLYILVFTFKVHGGISHLKVSYCFRVYNVLGLFRSFLPWWYHDGFDVVLAKVGVCMILCLHLLWLL